MLGINHCEFAQVCRYCNFTSIRKRSVPRSFFRFCINAEILRNMRTAASSENIEELLIKKGQSEKQASLR